MFLEVSVTTDPLIVYAVVALLLGSVVAALAFSRPRRGLGAARSSDARATAGSELPWMPGTGIFERPEPPPPSSGAAVAPPQRAAAPSAPSASPAPLPPSPGATPPWDER